ncbi:hypothetical protein KA005_06875 [bacterium]|nr:hypothetical protein [bacterium]
MQKIKQNKPDIVNFFRREILITRIAVDNARREYLLENVSSPHLHGQDKPQTEKKKKLTTHLS